MVPRLAPMLAESGAPMTPLDEWSAEPKFDGWRALVSVDPEDGLTVRTRRGNIITESVPELEGLAGHGLRLVLDGELVSGAGRMSDFCRLAPTLASRKRAPGGVTFVAFDVLWLNDTPLIDLRYSVRRAFLERLSDLVVVAPTFAGCDAQPLLDACQMFDVEGVVLKHVDSKYLPGRKSSLWRKLKCDTWRELHSERRRPR